MYKVLQTFDIPGHARFEAGEEYDIIPNAKEMIARGLVVKTEKMVEQTPGHARTGERTPEPDKNDKGQNEAKNSKRVAK